MNAATRKLVRLRAEGRCEYCRLPQSAQPFVIFHIEHIIAKQHGGSDDPENLCVACDRCNFHKGTNLSGVDLDTGNVERLFDPRRQAWAEHFELKGPVILGKTPCGRATAAVLAMNEEARVELRAAIIALGEF